MSGEFIYPNRDHKFIIKEWLDGAKILGLQRFNDYLSIEDVDQILDEALKVCKEVVAPTHADGENIRAVFKDGRVTVPPSFHQAWDFLQKNGWGVSNKDITYKGALPSILFGAVREFIIAANPALATYLDATGGIASLINAFASPRLIKQFTPKMFEGVWGGTMCLTEPGAGSDNGDLLCKAHSTEDPLIYNIKGNKCFITGGDHDLTENIIHVVLARVDGAALGTKGLSLFIVPKLWVNADGSLGDFNDVTTVSIETKMGLKGSATAVLNFGEEGKCRGFLIGKPPDEQGFGEGMAQMFKMINDSRVSSGQIAVSVAGAAYFHAVEYAKQRIQGRLITNPKGSRVPIIRHEDVRRMLITQKATLDAMRAMVFMGYYYSDLLEFAEDTLAKEQAKRRLDVITPLIKAYCTDQAWGLIAEAIQIHGGYGYTEDYPVARLARHCKIFSIWEGTSFIQSMDLVGRKQRLENGALFQEWLDEQADFIQVNGNNPSFEREFELMRQALAAYKEVLTLVNGYYANNLRMVPLYSTRVLRITAELYSGCLLLQQALIAERKLNEQPSEQAFYSGKIQSARFYVRNIVPDVMSTTSIIKECDTSALDIPEEAF